LILFAIVAINVFTVLVHQGTVLSWKATIQQRTNIVQIFFPVWLLVLSFQIAILKFDEYLLVHSMLFVFFIMNES
jgi:hypothetical protein